MPRPKSDPKTDALRRQGVRSAPESQPGWSDWDGQHCVDCDEQIPPLRLKMSRIRCIDCQELLERAR